MPRPASDVCRHGHQLVAGLFLSWLIVATVCGQGPADPSPSSAGLAADPNQPFAASTTIGLNLLQLVWTARWLMSPIIFMSIVVVAVGLERMVALRRGAVMPARLVRVVLEATSDKATFRPRSLLDIADDYPSPAARVVHAAVLKIGRPVDEFERAVTDAMQRESERLYRNVRTLNLAAAVTPLMGLLGTVWGMIQAFYATANLPAGSNKAEVLAEGIYTALVTTAGGLIVAIPAAILAHWFEGRIQCRFADIYELVQDRLLPQAERLEHESGKFSTGSATPPPVPPPVRQASH